ncbi:unnamed protein product [Cylicostephanus goldi]|uniref:Uncharacterized protein n=1 Tax=Cylicostephanus goldi TaxID=71465 RepID=A0A3P7MWW9_CYLGO|nr:unnamed protein product [Cylicostephanus goldi]
MKEFKAIITFARQHFCDVSLYFDKAGSPLIVGVESDAGFSAEFIIATLDGEDDTDEEAAPATTQELSNEGTNSTLPRRDSTAETNVSQGDIGEIQRNLSEGSAEMPPTQPSRNPLVNEVAMESVSGNCVRDHRNRVSDGRTKLFFELLS